MPLCQSFALVHSVRDVISHIQICNAGTQSIVLLSIAHGKMLKSLHWQLHHLVTWLTLQLVSISCLFLYEENRTQSVWSISYLWPFMFHLISVAFKFD
jgi:hypothetical protein